MLPNMKTKWKLTILLAAMAGLLVSGPALADTLNTTEIQITTSDAYDTTPTLGADSTGEMVVFTSRPALPEGGFGWGEIKCQRLNADGTTFGLVITVSDGTTDDRLNDVSGSRIVYTAYESRDSQLGRVMVYDLETQQHTTIISEAETVFEARIFGDMVVWTQGQFGALKVMYYDLSWSSSLPVIIGGSIAPASNVDIGDTYVVWEANVEGQRDIVAYYLFTGLLISVSSVADLDERRPATSGDFVVWESTAMDGSKTIELADLSQTPPTRTTVVSGSGGGGAYSPSIDGDLVAYYSNPAGDADIYLYRISDAETFQVTNDPAHQWLNNLYGNKVAYVDDRSGPLDVYVSTFSFVPDSPLICVAPPSGLVGWWPGDGDADDIWSENHGTLMNGATFAAGKVGQAFSFDGVDDYVQIPYDASFNLSNFTLQAWVKFPQTSYATIIGRPQGGNSTDGFSFFRLDMTSDNKIGGGVQGEGSAYTVSVSTAPTTFNDGEWHLCTFVRDVDAGGNGEIRIYVDAYAPWSYSDSSPGDMEHNLKGITIGSYDGSTSFFKGLIDEVAIWNRALSADEILAIFNAGGKCKVQDIDVSPAEYDFVEVELDTSSTVIVTISNVGTGDLTVDSIEFAAGSSGDFSITSALELPAVVAPGGSLGDVEITYTPSAAGLAEAGLEIGSDDPDEPSVVVSLSGTGVEVEPLPSEQIQVILDFFDASVGGGTLVGDGPGQSAENRLNALRNMVETAGDLIEDGLLDEACEQLQAAYMKTDSEPRPPDFVTGEAASELASLIQDLMTNIGCG